jgi:hypothetical protein
MLTGSELGWMVRRIGDGSTLSRVNSGYRACRSNRSIGDHVFASLTVLLQQSCSDHAAVLTCLQAASQQLVKPSVR